MPPRQRVRSEPFLTSERRLELLEHIQARREARIATGLPYDAVDPKEEEEEDVGDDGDADLQAEQQAILGFLRSESAAEARRCCRQEMEAQYAAEKAEMLAYMDEVEREEDEPEPSYPPVQPAPCTVDMDISDNEK